MPPEPPPDPWQALERVKRVLDEFEQAWRNGPRPDLREWLSRHPDLRAQLGPDLLELEWRLRRKAGETPSHGDYADLPPDWIAWTDKAEELSRTQLQLAQDPVESVPTDPMTSPTPGEPSLPTHIGRFAIEARLGTGGFGSVYLARDSDLERLVAIKVPHPHTWSRVAESWIREARIVAQFDHPHIVPVYEVGSTTEHPAFIVSKYIDGGSLADRLRQSPLPLVEAVDLVIHVAEALDYANRTRDEVVHRDIKPANLLLDQQGKVYVADFGLALRESDPVRQGDLAGTPAYMSPEQIRGEGHRVDVRSDIFSLGVVLYELLTGRRPFRGKKDDLFHEILHSDPRPPRQVNAQVSPELERICLKALAKRAADRYSTARDLANDLRHVRATEWLPGSAGLAPPVATPLSPLSPAANTPPGGTPSPLSPGPISPPGSSPGSTSRTVPIVPKGLRAFDAGDAGFFLDLLPGARDREGLPESVRFWKRRIEPTEGERPFPVGLLCGPSGCGKSSLVKAGLLPRLSAEVLPLYLEATSDDTERRLLALLHRHLPKLEGVADLAECLAQIRRGQAGLGRRKLLLVIDQFEQWLHAHQGEADQLLTQSLRQCDGDRLQCLLLVRDDYALAVFDFLRELEIPLLQGENSAVVSRFGCGHARQVLEAFGRAMRQLPPEPQELTAAQTRFLDEAVASLAEQNQVVPVRLALFAEMFRNRPWTPEGLLAVGGAEGVGRAFLEETFRSDSAPPHHRRHAVAAQRVLTALLPEAGSDIKGHRKSQRELEAAAGYAGRPREAAELFRILDAELRLISPVETEASPVASNESPPPASDRNYHLAHDYLVPSLRRWVEEILGSSPAGRAKLLLRERSRVWNDRPLNRHLPSVAEHLRIRRWVRPTERTEPEQRLLRQTAGVHGRWAAWTTVGLVLLAMGVGWLWQERRQREAVAQVQVLESAVASDWTRTFDTLRREGLAPLAARPLRARLAEAQSAAESLTVVKMRAGLLATQGDTAQVEPLAQALLTLPPAEFAVVRELVADAPDPAVVATLWDQAQAQSSRPASQRFQAAAVLARLAPDDSRWSALAPSIAGHLVALPAAELVAWRALLQPVRQQLASAVSELVEQAKLDPILRRAAAETLVDFARDQGSLVAQAMLQSEPPTFQLLFGTAQQNAAEAIAVFEEQLAEPERVEGPDEEHERRHQRKARAAAGLARLGRPEGVWPWLVFDPQPEDKLSQDPSLRTEVLHGLAEYGVPWPLVVDRLARGLESARSGPRDVRETSIQRALLLALGVYTGTLSAETRQTVIDRLRLRQVFQSDPDPGIHSASELLLRRWGERTYLARAQAELAQDAARPPAPQAGEPRTWFVNSQQQTFVVFPPGVFTMGSPPEERGRNKHSEHQHQRRIERSFALAATEVTRTQYAVFAKATRTGARDSPYSKTRDDPQTMVIWFEAAAYCNWLSVEEGLQRCYRMVGSGPSLQVELEPNFLDRNGYRLPTEAEWEYACRSGVAAAWGHGRAERQLGQYAWFFKNSDNHLWPVGRLLPNEAGLFDTSGNGMEWCAERGVFYPQGNDVQAMWLDSETRVDPNTYRVLRGGSFGYTSAVVRAASRDLNRPDDVLDIVSFRPSRTYP
ncbi:MAG: protein kinase domain-containing protein [Planctomycetaceae bacterium]